MTENYVVSLPFSLPNGKAIDVPRETSVNATALGLPAELRNEGAHYVLVVEGVPSVKQARATFEKLSTGLLWAAVDARTGVRLSKAEVENPPLRGIIQSDIPAIIRKADRKTSVVGIWGGVTTTETPAVLFERINAGAALPCSETFRQDAKLALALDLYCLAQFEASQSAKFVTLMIALEAAAPHKGHHSTRIAAYVRCVLRKEGDPAAKAAGEEAEKLYTLRSDLLHGKRGPELGNAPGRLHEITSKVLRAAMRQKV